jgi:hypothetical protein
VGFGTEILERPQRPRGRNWAKYSVQTERYCWNVGGCDKWDEGINIEFPYEFVDNLPEYHLSAPFIGLYCGRGRYSAGLLLSWLYIEIGSLYLFRTYR